MNYHYNKQYLKFCHLNDYPMTCKKPYSFEVYTYEECIGNMNS